MKCGKCGAKNSWNTRRCRRCKANPRGAGLGIGAHHEVSCMGHATKTKNKRRMKGRLACRKNKGRNSGFVESYS